MAAHQAPQSLEFSRQEHWSGVSFPSPMHESEMWKWSHSVVPDSSRPHGLQPTRLLRPRDFPGKSTGVGCRRLLWMKVCYHLFPKLTDSPVVSIDDSKPLPKLSFLNYLVSLYSLFCQCFSNMCYSSPITDTPTPPQEKKHTHKKRDKTNLAWFCCHLRSQLFFSLHSMSICKKKKKKLSQHLHFLSSPLLPTLSSFFHDHQNTAIISKVTYYLIFFTVFILELCWFPWGWPSPLLHLSLLCFLVDLVTLQFWFTSSFSNQLLNVSPLILYLIHAGGY